MKKTTNLQSDNCSPKIAVVVKFEGTVDIFKNCHLCTTFDADATDRVILVGWNTTTDILYTRTSSVSFPPYGKKHQLDQLVALESKCSMIVYCPAYTWIEWRSLFKMADAFAKNTTPYTGWCVSGPLNFKSLSTLSNLDNSSVKNIWEWLGSPWLMLLSLLFFVDWIGNIFIVMKDCIDMNNQCNTLYFEKLYTNNKRTVLRAQRYVPKWKIFSSPNVWHKDPATLKEYTGVSFYLENFVQVKYACKLFVFNRWIRTFVGVLFYAIITWYPIVNTIINGSFPTIYYWVVSTLVALFCYTMFPCNFIQKPSGEEEENKDTIFKSVKIVFWGSLALLGFPITLNFFGIPLLMFVLLKDFFLNRMGLGCLCPTNQFRQ